MLAKLIFYSLLTQFNLHPPAIPVRYKRTIPQIKTKNSGKIYVANNIEIPYPVKARSARTTLQESKIVGKNETPPNRGIARLCTFLSSGISNSFFRKEINRMRGIISLATQTEITKAIIINKIFISV